MNEWVSMVADVGFPAMITLYLLVRIEGKLEALNLSINELTQTLIRLRD